MLSTKTLHSIDHCQTVRDIYRNLESDISQTRRALREVEEQIDRLSHHYLAATSQAERDQVGDDQKAAKELYDNLKEEEKRLVKSLEPVLNDYIISGCDSVLGPL